MNRRQQYKSSLLLHLRTERRRCENSRNGSWSMREILFLLVGVAILIAAVFTEISEQAWTALLIGVCGGFIVGIQTTIIVSGRKLGGGGQ